MTEMYDWDSDATTNANGKGLGQRRQHENVEFRMRKWKIAWEDIKTNTHDFERDPLKKLNSVCNFM